MPPLEVANVIAATAEGYAFLTRLDGDQPIDGLSPPTRSELVADAVEPGMPVEQQSPRLTVHLTGRDSH
ncbi:MAG: hypothetical protein L0H79_07485 [Intrasporangium sp.]|uniref:hypothetical protein n=1 Tax=Intrasporangium sp. TaxID=1925024 RepID=UPI002647DAEB|nr:hypothetical protein [Intrasporangium sp.]MDN5795581.1 hypothetical protein [Intrasporangium sp.]